MFAYAVVFSSAPPVSCSLQPTGVGLLLPLSIPGDILYKVVLSGVFHCFFRLLVSFICFLRLLLASLCRDGFIDLCRYCSRCIALTLLFVVVLGGLVLSFGSTVLA